MNLGRTKAEWERFLGRELALVFLAALREVRESYDRATRQRTQVWNLNDATSGSPHFKALTLVGVDYGRNTSPEGRLWVWLTPTGLAAPVPAFDVRLFRAPGGAASSEVARAAGVAPGATAPLVAQLGSGLTGQVTLGLVVAAEMNDRHQLLVCVDFLARLPKVWNQLEGVETDAASRKVAEDMLAGLAALDLQKIDVVKRALARFLLRDGQRSPVGRGNEFNRAAARTLASDVEAPDRSGNVGRSRTGLLPLVADNMQDETVGGEQDVVRRLVKADAGVFDDENDGKGSVAAHLPLEKCPEGVYTLRCDAGADTDALGAETFSGEFVATDGSGETFTYSGVRVERDFTGPRGFGPIRIRRVYTKSGDGLHLSLAAPSTGHFHGESDINTDRGVVHWRLVENGPTFDIEFHRDSKRSQLVAKATAAVPGQPFEAVEQNASRLTVTWALGGLPTAGAEGTLDCNPFFVKNRAGVPDKFTITTAVVGQPGLIQRMLADELDAVLNSDAPGAESIPDEWAMAGTFVPFLAVDN